MMHGMLICFSYGMGFFKGLYYSMPLSCPFSEVDEPFFPVFNDIVGVRNKLCGTIILLCSKDHRNPRLNLITLIIFHVNYGSRCYYHGHIGKRPK